MATQASWTPASGKTACEVSFGADALSVDIDPAAGGSGVHPDPHDLLDGALASCTALTLELYIKRKGFAVQSIKVSVSHSKSPEGIVLKRLLEVEGTLSEEQKASLLRIADMCPIHKALLGEIAILTELSMPLGA